MSIFRKCPSQPTQPTQCTWKEVFPQEGQAVASLPGDEAEVGKQVLPISSGDKPNLMFKLQISLIPHICQFLMFDVWSDVQASNITHTTYLSVFFMFNVWSDVQASNITFLLSSSQWEPRKQMFHLVRWATTCLRTWTAWGGTLKQDCWQSWQLYVKIVIALHLQTDDNNDMDCWGERWRRTKILFICTVGALVVITVYILLETLVMVGQNQLF